MIMARGSCPPDHSSLLLTPNGPHDSAQVQQAEADFDPLPFDAQAARSFGQVAVLRRAGRKPAARAYDAMIAAVAIANGLPNSTPATRPTSQESTDST